jgi:hypothetical protein
MYKIFRYSTVSYFLSEEPLRSVPAESSFTREAQQTYLSIVAISEKLWDEVPGPQLTPIIGRFHSSGLPEYPGQVLEGLPTLGIHRFYQRI